MPTDWSDYVDDTNEPVTEAQIRLAVELDRIKAELEATHRDNDRLRGALYTLLAVAWCDNVHVYNCNQVECRCGLGEAKAQAREVLGARR